jgi:adenosylhomocysteine/aminodeoxyfutalosine nucleosidase
VIAILTAMREELSPLLDKVKVIKKHHIAGSDFYHAIYKNNELILTNSGIGKVSATLASTILIERFNADKILFSGVAGAIDDSLKVGDVVVADRTAQFDMNLTAFGHPLGHVSGTGVYAKTSQSLRAIAEDMGCISGTIISGDKFVQDIKEKETLAKCFNAIALEMEGAPVSFVCQKYDIECMIIRSISDTLHGSSEDFGEFLSVASNNSADMMLKIVNSLG